MGIFFSRVWLHELTLQGIMAVNRVTLNGSRPRFVTDVMGNEPSCATQGICRPDTCAARLSSSNSTGHLEDRQVHRNDQTTDSGPEEEHQQRLHHGGQSADCVINFIIERGFARARAVREMNQRHEPDEDAGPEEATATGADEPAATPRYAPPRTMNTFEALARRVAGILAFVAGTYAFFYIWDDNSTEMVESVTNQLLDVMVILFIGYIIYHAFRIWIDNKIAEEQGEMAEGELGDEGSGSSASRSVPSIQPRERS